MYIKFMLSWQKWVFDAAGVSQRVKISSIKTMKGVSSKIRSTLYQKRTDTDWLPFLFPHHNQEDDWNRFETRLRLEGLTFDLDPSLLVTFPSFQVLPPSLPPAVPKHAAWLKIVIPPWTDLHGLPGDHRGPSCETLHSAAFRRTGEGESVAGWVGGGVGYSVSITLNQDKRLKWKIIEGTNPRTAQGP